MLNLKQSLPVIISICAVLSGFHFLSGDNVTDKAMSHSENGSTSLEIATISNTQATNEIGPQALKSQSCRDCHQEIFEKWRGSHHALANKAIDPAAQDVAFVPEQTLTEGDKISTFTQTENGIQIETIGKSGALENFSPDMILAHTPLRQYLVPFPGGRWQVTEAAWDVDKKEWFNVYGTEERQPHEWGFWTNRGMNWNSQCATCHMTDFDKNYDFETDVFNSTWIEQGIGCVQCHGKIEKCPDQLNDFPINQSNPHAEIVMDNCASCHSRREELVEGFAPGDKYHDYHRIQLPNRPGMYYPDGQIQEEVFVYGSFKMSKMGQAGVSCQNCHDPHSLELIAPVENNALCLTCHGGSEQLGATTINPTEHSHHPAGSTGNSCVECHMTKTTYMQRDPRRDHGFIIPDPLLTKTMGIPNACNKCHTDESVDWAIEHTEKWYGEKMNRPERKRTEAIHTAFLGTVNNSEDLLNLYQSETNPIWKATLLDLAAQQVQNPPIKESALEALKAEDPILRTVAVRILSTYPQSTQSIQPMLKDSSRSVRLETALTLHNQSRTDEYLSQELQDYLAFHSDQPTGLSNRAQAAFNRGKQEEAENLLLTIADWDGNSPGSHENLALFYNATGKKEKAIDHFIKASQAAPENPQYPFNLALLYGELRDSPKAIEQLIKATTIAPGFSRAWYNLGLLYSQVQEPAKAIDSILKAEAAEPTNPDYCYARATIHLRMNNIQGALAAAEKALRINPNHRPAQGLIQHIQTRQ